jgi:hypothetical protein
MSKKSSKKRRRYAQVRIYFAVARPGMNLAMTPEAALAAHVATEEGWSEEELVRRLKQTAALPEDIFTGDVPDDPEAQAALQALRQLWNEV